MPMTDPALLRSFRAHPLAAAAFGACLVVAGVLLSSDAYVEPHVARIESARPVWTEETAFTYQVPVTRNESIWPIGTDLGMGRAAYYRSVSQYVHLNFTWHALDVDPEGGMASASLSVRLRGEDARGNALWEVREPMTADVVGDPARGLALAGTLDLDDVAQTIARLTRELPLGDGFVNWTVEADVTYDVRTNEGLAASTERFVFPLALNDPRLYLPPPDEVAWTRVHEARIIQESVAPAGWTGVATTLPALVLLLGGMTLLGGAGWAWRIDPGRGLPARDAAWAREHARFEEWVTTADAPTDWGTTFVDVPSLEDLVRVAADGRARILLDRASRTYYVPHALLTYRYARHARSGPPLRP